MKNEKTSEITREEIIEALKKMLALAKSQSEQIKILEVENSKLQTTVLNLYNKLN